MPNFHVGGMVVVVDDTRSGDYLRNGEIYFVTSLDHPSQKLYPNSDRFLLIDHPQHGGAYFRSRFRPVEFNKTGFGLLEKIAAGARQPEGVEA